MKVLLLPLSAILFCLTTKAQHDSDYVNLGRIKTLKAFTQTIVIKANDLERLPFANLSEAIRLWANGANTDKRTIAYVIDGIALNDIDAYNIRDIEEIVIVQNSLAQINGAGNTQLLAVVSTKKAKHGKAVLTFASQAYAVNRKLQDKWSRDEKLENSSTGFFHEYFGSISGGTKKGRYGGSLNYLHDVLPQVKNNNNRHIETAPGMERLRLNVWGETDLNKHNSLRLHVNYTPQFSASRSIVSVNSQHRDERSRLNESIFNATLQLNTTSTKRLITNTFTAGFIKAWMKGNEYAEYITTQNDSVTISSNGSSDQLLTTHNFILNDNIGFHVKVGEWLIEPAVNFNYQHTEFRYKTYIEAKRDNNPYLISSSEQYFRYNSLMSSPNISISFKNFVNLQGGLLVDVSRIVQKNVVDERLYPFASIGINLLPKANANKATWKIYGSYARYKYTSDNPYKLNDLNFSSVENAEYPPGLFSAVISPFPVYKPEASDINTNWQAGTEISLFKNKLSVGYNLLHMEDLAVTYTYIPAGSTIPVFGKLTIQRNQVRINTTLIDKEYLQWRSGLYINFISSTSDYETPWLLYKENFNTGGWTNRFVYEKFSAGVDILHLFNKVLRDDRGVTTKYNAIQLQHIYVAYTLKTAFAQNVDIYVSCRNAVDSQIYPLSPDRKKYYGGGLKIIL